MHFSLVQRFGRLTNRFIRYADRFRLTSPEWNSANHAATLARFHEASGRYATTHESLLMFKSTHGHTEPHSSLYPWPAWEQRLAREFSQRVPPRFTEHPIVKETMVFHGRVCNYGRIACVRRAFGDSETSKLLAEDPVGAPRICDASLCTSSNRLYHAFHLAMYQQTTGKGFAGDGMIVEWGGGYGDMARLLWRFNAGSNLTTIVLIDLPAVGALQWVYLTAILGRDAVRIIAGPDQKIHKGCVNIMNSAVAFEHPELLPQCFISTWALTESPHPLQSEVVLRDFFGARNVLLAFSLDVDNQVAAPLRATGGVTIPVPFMSFDGYAPSSYGFK